MSNRHIIKKIAQNIKLEYLLLQVKLIFKNAIRIRDDRVKWRPMALIARVASIGLILLESKNVCQFAHFIEVCEFFEDILFPA